jgi:hypothetical protein
VPSVIAEQTVTDIKLNVTVRTSVLGKIIEKQNTREQYAISIVIPRSECEYLDTG